MLYTGRSTACHTCRRRRVKCDEVRPECLKCRRTGRSCLGYPEEGLKIMDMTEKVKNRRQSTKSTKRGSVASDGGGPASAAAEYPLLDLAGALSRTSRMYDGSIPDVAGHREQLLLSDPLGRRPSRSMPVHLEELTMTYFRNWTTGPLQTLDPGYLPVFKAVCAQEITSATLSACLLALSLGAFSMRPSSRSIILQARIAYGRALQKVQQEVQQPHCSGGNNELIASILMLGLFEHLCSDDSKGWCAHITAAAAVVGIRKKVLSGGRLGRLLLRVISNEMLKVVQLGLSSPHKGSDKWHRWLQDPKYHVWLTPDQDEEKGRPDEEEGVRGSEAMEQVVTGGTGALPTPRVCMSSEGITELGNRLSEHEAQLAFRQTKALIQSFARSYRSIHDGDSSKTMAWEYRRDEATDSRLFPPGPVYIYPTFKEASLQIAGCTARLLISNVMARCAASMSLLESPDYLAARAIARSDANEVIQSIAYFCGLTEQKAGGGGGGGGNEAGGGPLSPPASTTGDPAGGPANPEPHKLAADMGDSDMAQRYTAYMIIWPMSSVAAGEFLDETQWNYLLGMYDFISDHFGVRIAGGMKKWCMEQRKASGLKFFS